MYKYSLFFFLFFLSSCFYKSDKKGKADDVKEVVIYRGSGGPLIITKEEVFHASSKSSGGGVTYIVGQARYRYTTYDPETGIKVARFVAGSPKEKECTYLGQTDGHLWFFSVHKSLLLHSRDPRTLQVKTTYSDIVEKNPQLKDQLSQPDWPSVRTYFGWDPSSGSIILSTLSGDYFLMHPENLSLTPVKEGPDFRSGHGPLSSDIYLTMRHRFRLDGQLKKSIVSYTDRDGERSREQYLNGTFIHNENALESEAYMQKVSMAVLNQLIDSLHIICSEQSKTSALCSQLDTLQQDFSSYENEIDNLMRQGRHDIRWWYAVRNQFSQIRNLHSINVNIGDDTSCVYIIHANNTTDTSSILVSRLRLEKDGMLTNAWTVLLPRIFYHPSKAIQTGDFKKVFSSGNPQWNYEWYGIAGNTLVGVKMLHSFGINTETGEVKWIRRL